MHRAGVAAALALAGCAYRSQSPPHPDHPADFIVLAHRIYTADTTQPVAEAFAVRGHRIVAVGKRDDVLRYRGTVTQVLDFADSTVIPGIADAHAHLLSLGRFLQNVDLTGASSYDEVIARVVARARTVPAGSWILGRGWDQNRWPE